eukprot:11893544-Prorocentrum_lima.AAC.1
MPPLLGTLMPSVNSLRVFPSVAFLAVGSLLRPRSREPRSCFGLSPLMETSVAPFATPSSPIVGP